MSRFPGGSMSRGPRVLFAGGGTGGHLCPGLAVAQELLRQEPDASLEFLVPGKTVDRYLLGETDFAWQTDPLRPPRKLVEFFSRLSLALPRVQRQFRRLAPQVIVALGGYGSLSAGLVARWRGIPLVLLEQNAIPGKVTRFLSRWATEIYAPWSLTGLSRVALLGNPVRREILAAAPRSAKSGRPLTVLILGGSQGARRINDGVLQILPQLTSWRDRLRFLHITGAQDAGRVSLAYRQLRLAAQVYPFVHLMASCYQESDLAISRAGGTTLAELAAVGLPALLIPLPQAADHHQEANAETFARAGAARLVTEGNWTQLAEQLQELLHHPDEIAQMSLACRGLARPQAASQIAQRIVQLAEKTKKY